MSDVIYSESDEKALLGCLLGDADTLKKHVDSIRESDFFVPAHKRLFREICRLHDAGEIIRLEKFNQDDFILCIECVSASVLPNCESYLRIVKRDSIRRRRIEENLIENDQIVDDPQFLGTIDERIEAVSVCDIQCDPENDPDELLKSRFLCRGGAAMLNGPTGIGKSSFIMQAAVLWSLGKPFFDISPVKPLKSLIIQAENDNGDLVEMREGVFQGIGLSAGEKALVREGLLLHSESSKTGEVLINEVLRPLLRTHGPDLVWLDNLFAYSGCNVSDQEKMSLFLRNLINPLIQEFRCAIVIAHHTNKPPSGDQKADWSVSETSYLGAGSAELANWPRAILSIRTLKTQGVFELVAGKRGSRLAWKDSELQPTCRQNIAHSRDGLIYWRQASNEQMESQGSKVTKYDVQSLVVIGQEISKEALISKANELMGVNKAKGFISELIGDGILKVIEKPRSRTNPAIYLERVL